MQTDDTRCLWQVNYIIGIRSEEHTSELQSQSNLVCRLLLEKKNIRRSHPSRFPRPVLVPPARRAPRNDPCSLPGEGCFLLPRGGGPPQLPSPRSQPPFPRPA